MCHHRSWLDFSLSAVFVSDSSLFTVVGSAPHRCFSDLSRGGLGAAEINLAYRSSEPYAYQAASER